MDTRPVHPLLESTHVTALIPKGQTIDTLKKVPFNANVQEALALLDSTHITHLPVTGSVEGLNEISRFFFSGHNFRPSTDVVHCVTE